MRAPRFLAILVAATSLLAVGSSDAADLELSYLVDARAFRKAANAETPIVVTIYRDRDCTQPVDAETIPAGDLDVIEKVRRLALRGAGPDADTARLSATLRDVDASGAAWVTLAGPGVSAVGGGCQSARSTGTASIGACPPDAVPLGPVCVDKYEASVWQVPAARADIVRQIKSGTITKAALVDAGAIQVREASAEGCDFEEYGPAFPLDGNYTEPRYAVSLPGVVPSNCITARQATAACALAGKRLLALSEWYHAAIGTPFPEQDDGVSTCVLHAPAPLASGSRAACVSTIGAFDMLGNLYEWTNPFPVTTDVEGLAWIIGSAFHVGTGNATFPASVQGPIAVHTDTGFRCAR
jgi:hypothetical protein